MRQRNTTRLVTLAAVTLLAVTALFAWAQASV